MEDQAVCPWFWAAKNLYSLSVKLYLLPSTYQKKTQHPPKQTKKPRPNKAPSPPKLLVIWTSVLIAHLRSYIQNLQEVQKHFWICCCSYFCSSHPPIAWCLSYKTCMFLMTGLQVLLVSLLKHGNVSPLLSITCCVHRDGTSNLINVELH